MGNKELLKELDELVSSLESLISRFGLYSIEGNLKVKNILNKIYEINANYDFLKNSTSKLLIHKIREFIISLNKIKTFNELVEKDYFEMTLNEFYLFLKNNNLLNEKLGRTAIISYTNWETCTGKDGKRYIKNEAEDPVYIEKNKSEYLNTYSNKIESKLKEKKAISNLEFNDVFDDYEPSLKVKEIAQVFSKYLLNYSSEHTTTLIGVFGKWGRGKTLFCNQLKKEMEKKDGISFLKFQPWKYQEKESLWAYLYQNLLEHYLNNSKNKTHIPKFANNIINIVRLNIRRIGLSKLIVPLLFILLSGVLIFTEFTKKIEFLYSVYLILGISTFFLIYKLYKFFIFNKDAVLYLYEHYGRKKDFSDYLGFQNEIEKEIKILINAFVSDDERLVLFIDDLDRCEEAIIIEVMDTLRLVLEDKSINSKIMIICAIDEEILMNSIRFKYYDNKFNKVNPREYIEKFFLLGLKLSKLDSTDINMLIDVYIKKLNSLINSDSFSEFETSEKPQKEKKDFPKYCSLEKENDIEKLNILNDGEISHVKLVLSNTEIDTPRKINIFIQRYLLFKSFVLSEFNNQYINFPYTILIEIVICSKINKFIPSLLNQIKNEKSNKILLVDCNKNYYSLEKEHLKTLLKYAEMVNPF